MFVASRINCVIASVTKTLSSVSYKRFEKLKFVPLKTFCSQKDETFDIDYQKLSGGDEELLKKLKVIMLEFEVLRDDGHKVPQKMNEERWNELLHASSRSKRLKQLLFWWTNERKKEKDKERKEQKRLELEQRPPREISDHITYGFGGSSIFLRIYDTAIDHHNNKKLIDAMMFGQKLVIDCSYDEDMNMKESSLCSKQLTFLFAENRAHKSPYDLYFCNANPKGNLIPKLQKSIPTLYDKDFPLNITEKSYLDMFPKEQLVYLTPHCREDLIKYSHDDIYIIGAMVDKDNNQPLSLAKAKSQGLRMAKLPIDRYLDWGVGTKSLTLNQVINILLDLKVTGDWHEALKHVPLRKLKREDEATAMIKRQKHAEFKRNRLNISGLYS